MPSGNKWGVVHSGLQCCAIHSHRFPCSCPVLFHVPPAIGRQEVGYHRTPGAWVQWSTCHPGVPLPSWCRAASWKMGCYHRRYYYYLGWEFLPICIGAALCHSQVPWVGRFPYLGFWFLDTWRRLFYLGVRHCTPYLPPAEQVPSCYNLGGSHLRLKFSLWGTYLEFALFLFGPHHLTRLGGSGVQNMMPGAARSVLGASALPQEVRHYHLACITSPENRWRYRWEGTQVTFLSWNIVC